MKMTKVAAFVAVLVLLLFVAMPNLSWAAEDGAALYKTKCANCHGPDAAGKPAMKAPAVKGKSDADIKKAIETSPKHASVKSLTADQVKAVADYLKTVK
jgi:mono/diheme cytochrome c family protein